MLRLILLFVCFCTGLGSVRRLGRSPNADIVQEYFKNGELGRYSNNLWEDAQLDVPGLISKYGYPIEVHSVVTEDGYIIEMHRIPHGRDSHNTRDPNKPSVLVMHGLLTSSADWVIMGPGSALAYVLADAGFDVWLGNARGTYYSRNHVNLNPDTSKDFWLFSFDQIGTGDLTAMIDYILEETGKARIHYIGHSQGTTAFWAMASLRPEYNDKIITMQAFAPVAYLKYNEYPLFVAVAPYATGIEKLTSMLGVYDILARNEFFNWIGKIFCSDYSITQSICSDIIFFAAGGEADMHNATMLPVKLGHAPAGASVRQIVHYGQQINQDFFRRYDYGALRNWDEYRSFTPPNYDLSKVTAPVYLHYAEQDIYAHVNDVYRLHNELSNPVGLFRVPHATFSHLDFSWGIGAKSLLYDRVIDMMKSHNTNT